MIRQQSFAAIASYSESGIPILLVTLFFGIFWSAGDEGSEGWAAEEIEKRLQLDLGIANMTRWRVIRPPDNAVKAFKRTGISMSIV